jgi:glycosyltransferase involved in cell wall biosynthesis
MHPVADIILPVLDERDALPWVLERIPPGFHPIVVDNGSVDGSADVAAALGAEVVSEPRRGFGFACAAGLEAARDALVCFMDCDGSFDPSLLPMLSRPVLSGDADLVIGARNPERGAWPFHARAANRLLAWEVRRRTGIRLHDIGPMRAARREDLLGLDVRDRGFGWPLEMVLLAGRAGWRVMELPVDYRRRRTGRSKVTGSVRGSARALRDMGRALR